MDWFAATLACVARNMGTGAAAPRAVVNNVTSFAVASISPSDRLSLVLSGRMACSILHFWFCKTGPGVH